MFGERDGLAFERLLVVPILATLFGVGSLSCSWVTMLVDVGGASINVREGEGL